MKGSEFLTRVADRVSPDSLRGMSQYLQDVEGVLHESLNFSVALVQQSANVTLIGGGKRFRPSLVYLSACACGSFDYQRSVQLGACMEMIHMATLIHDDVIDHAESRRGQPTACALYGNTASVLSGDALLAKAMVLLADDGDLEIIRHVSRVVVDLAQGEVRELEHRGHIEMSQDEHMEILNQKTATFIAACCYVGSKIADDGSNHSDALLAYGSKIGMAFQIADDMLDYLAEPTKTGKPRATDFREGCPTLPLICLWQKDIAHRDVIKDRFVNGQSEDDIDEIVAWMKGQSVFAEVTAISDQFITDAKQQLSTLPESDAKYLLASAAEFVCQREA